MAKKFLLNTAFEVCESGLEEELKSRGKEPELPLNSLPELNRKIWGLRKGRLTLIGARTSQGKSAFSLQVAYDVARQGKPVLFLSLEMSNNEMAERLFCNVFDIDNYHLLTGHFGEYQEQWLKFKEHLNNVPLSFSDCMGYTWKEIDTYLSNLTKPFEVVIVDYIQAIRGNSKSQKESFDDYILHFREMAVRHNYAGVLCSQVNRASQESKSREPALHQLKGTGVLEEHSDVVCLLHWPHKYDPEKSIHEYHLMLEKNRGGRTGFMKLHYIPEYYKFVDAPKEQAEYQKVMGGGVEIDWED